MNELALFAGAGGGILGSHILGWRTVCAVERDAYAAQVLAQRQNDGILPIFPIWSDITTFDGKPWAGIIDVISGGFPCQDISSAGKGAGITGERSGLWSEMARIISEVRPRFVFVENSPMLVGRGLARVIGDITQMGYDAQWARFSASNFGAPHIRDRIWIVGHPISKRLNTGWHNNSQYDRDITSTAGEYTAALANSQSIGWQQTRQSQSTSSERTTGCGNEFSHAHSKRCAQMEQRIVSGSAGERAASQVKHSSSTRGGQWWSSEPKLGRVADGVAHRVDRLKAIGNGQVPIVAKGAFRYLSEAIS